MNGVKMQRIAILLAYSLLAGCNTIAGLGDDPSFESESIPTIATSNLSALGGYNLVVDGEEEFPVYEHPAQSLTFIVCAQVRGSNIVVEEAKHSIIAVLDKEMDRRYILSSSGQIFGGVVGSNLFVPSCITVSTSHLAVIDLRTNTQWPDSRVNIAIIRSH